MTSGRISRESSARSSATLSAPPETATTKPGGPGGSLSRNPRIDSGRDMEGARLLRLRRVERRVLAGGELEQPRPAHQLDRRLNLLAETAEVNLPLLAQHELADAHHQLKERSRETLDQAEVEDDALAGAELLQLAGDLAVQH